MCSIYLQTQSLSNSHGVGILRIVQDGVEWPLVLAVRRAAAEHGAAFVSVIPASRLLHDFSTRLTIETKELAIVKAVLLLGVEVTVRGGAVEVFGEVVSKRL